MIIDAEVDPRISELLTFKQAAAETGLSYFQLRYGLDQGHIEAVRLTEDSPHLLVRSSLEDFVKLREQKRARLVDTPSSKEKSNTRRAGREVS